MELDEYLEVTYPDIVALREFQSSDELVSILDIVSHLYITSSKHRKPNQIIKIDAWSQCQDNFFILFEERVFTTKEKAEKYFNACVEVFEKDSKWQLYHEMAEDADDKFDFSCR